MKLFVTEPETKRLRNIGWYNEENKIYYKRIDPRKHIMNKIPGIDPRIGIQNSAIEKLKRVGCEWVVCCLPGYKLVSTFSQWLDDSNHPTDYKHGKQRFLYIHLMIRKEKGEEI